MPQPSMPVRMRAGSTANAAPMASRTAACAGWSSCQYVSSSQPPSLASRMNTLCWPEHMWRRADGRSPSRASRDAVRASSGIPSDPHASTDCAIPSRRNSAWTVRTWTSSPEWLDVMIASSSPVRSNSRRPPARSRAIRPNGFIADRRFTIRSGSPSRWSIRPAASTSTMSPRWTDSTVPLRTCRTTTGGTDHFAIARGARGSPGGGARRGRGPGGGSNGHGLRG